MSGTETYGVGEGRIILSRTEKGGGVGKGIILLVARKGGVGEGIILFRTGKGGERKRMPFKLFFPTYSQIADWFKMNYKGVADWQ